MNVVKRLLGCVREFKLASILTPTFIALEVVCEVVIPYVIAMLVNNIKAGPDLGVITKYGLMLIGLAVLSLACGALSGYFGATASCGFAKNVRHDLFHKVQEFSFSNIDKFSTSSLVTRLTTDVTNVQNAYMMILRITVRSPLMFVFSLIMSFVMAPTLSWAFIVVIPFLLTGIILITRRTMPIFRRIFIKYDNLNNSVQENVKAMRVVKSFVREDFEKQKFERASDEVRADFTKAEKNLALTGPIMQFAMNSVMILVSYFGATIIIKSGAEVMDVGQLSSLLTYGIQLLSSLMMLSMIYVMITMSAESARRIYEVLVEQSSISNPENPIFEVADGSIDFDHVNFRYSEKAERDALSDINLHIKSGETIGILGSTGSSKSTLIQLISRLYDVTGGSVKVGGVDVRDYDLETLRNQVSVVLQKNVLFSGTIKDNLRWGDENASDEEIVNACKLAQADEFIRTFPQGYDTYIEQGGSNVSGGQRQRLCIARSILKKPKILILDDSTSAVDTKTDALIRAAFLKEIPNTTKIIIAQRVASVQEADQIVIMDGGMINAIGKHEDLVRSNPIYQEVYYSQNTHVKAGEN